MTKRGRRTSYTPEQVEEWARQFQAGKNWVQIFLSDDRNPSPETIKAAVVRVIGEAKASRKAPALEDIERWLVLYENGFGFSHIATLENSRFSSSAIRRHLLERGVEPRDRNWYRTREAIAMREEYISSQRLRKVS